MTQIDSVDIWLFLPGSNGNFKTITRLIQSYCKERNWKVYIRTAKQERSKRDAAGRPIGLISNQDALNLYKRIHIARTGVWQIGYAHAPIKLRPKSIFDYVELRRYIRHKAFHHTLPRINFDTHWSESIEEFNTWLRQTWCNDEGDPRCLPLHVFRTSIDAETLATPEGRSSFADTHGPQSSRLDAANLRWDRPKGQYHGRQTLQVAGRYLAQGFHWDVSSDDRRQRQIHTTAGTWDIKPSGYVNVYPDQYIRAAGPRVRKLKIKAR